MDSLNSTLHNKPLNKASKETDKGAFNNYVDKKRGRGGQPKVHACPPGGRGGPLNVHVDQNPAISYYCAV